MGIKFSFEASTNTPEYPVEVKLIINDEVVQAHNMNTEHTLFEYILDSSKNTEYNVQIEMSGKTDNHTIFIDNEVKQSTLIEIKNMQLGEFKLTPAFLENIATYHHNSNGRSEFITEPYTSNLGCNGAIKFTCKIPLYDWLLGCV